VAVNNDGRTAGPATPNIQAQKEVMQTALEKTEIKPVEISYIEVNGSGSEVTDLLELKALEAVYGPFHKTPCSLGSAKPNIGHPLCAEGMAGFIKLVLMLERRQQVPFLSGESPMSHYKIESSPFSFCRELTEWAGTTRVAALNCFADGGTNAHVILESLPEDQPGNSELTLVHRKPISPPELQRVRIREGSGTFPQRERDPIKITNPWTETLDSNHPVFKSHTAFGQELLPGLAYIDLLYQYFREKGYAYDELELRNLSIFHPLIVRQGDNIRLDIQCSKVKPDVWKIQVKGQEKLYINAEMHRQEPTVFEERLDFNSIRNSAQKTVPLSDIYDQCRNLELVHTGFLKARGTIYSLDDANFIQISLPPEATPGAYDFMFHPTLLDSSAVGSGGLFSSQAKQELFLPLFYKSFRASSLLQSQCITRIRTSSREEKKELISLDMEFFHVSGEKIGELKNFTNKRVPETGFVNPSQRKATPQKTNGRPSLQQNRRTADSSERFLKEVIASQLKISTEEIDSDCGYYEMGLSSSMLLLVVKEIEKKLSTTLSPILLFEYTNIRELANHLKELAGSSPEETHQEVQSVAFDEREGSFKPLSATVSTEEVGAEDTDDIAIIGLAGRYPGAENIEEFWINLKAGKDCITTIPSERWDEKIWENLKSPTGKKLSKWGGFIQNHDCFDPQFFRISPREAETMDPQERLFLQACSEVMEDAGYTASNLVVPHGRHQRRKVGVFVGVMHNDYTIIGAESITTGERFPLSINYAPIANRVSYYYNFHGPSLAIDTVCSSSLTAVHLAIGSILRGESQVAIAGGVNLSLHPNKYLTYGLMDMHASDGRCHTFGDGGDGYVSGEGIGAVLLKPLKRAVQDQDHIYAVIKGSAINHGGKVSGFTVPSPVAHSHVIEECLERAGIGARTISCVEAHGTGTSLGDPIEIQGLAKAYAQNTSDLQFCSIGSVKSNIGHAESAAGISGLSKVVLQLHHKTLVPSLHAETENPHINFKASPFFVQHKTETWQQPVITSNGKSHSCPRRAGLSSFGAYGSNAHLILEEYIPQTVGSMAAGDTKNSPVLIPLSAKNEERLRVYANKLHTFLEEADQSIDLRQIAYTLQFGREAMEARVVFLVKKNEELHEKLKAFAGGESITNHCWQGGLKQEKKTISLFSPEDIQQMVNKWIAEGKLEKLAELWAQGFTLNWQSLYEEGDSQHVGCADGRPLRVSLPTYPFAKQRYWVPTDRQADTIQRQTTVSDSVITPLSPHVLPQDGLVSVESPVHSLLLAPVWNSLTFPESNIPVPAKTEQVVIVGGTQDQKSKIKQLYPLADLLQMDNPQTIDELVNKITTLGSIEHFVWIVPSIPLISMAEESIIQDQDQGIFPVFRVIKALLSLGYGDQVLSWTFITTQTLAVGRQEEVNPTHASLHGLIGSVAKEYPRWKIRYLDMETEGDWPIREIFLLPFDVQGEALVYRRKEWFKATLVSYRSSFSDHPLYRPEGVYVVIGGSGGLGEVWSKYMIEHYQARIIWIGRRKMNEEIQHKLDVLAKLGPAPQYISADATNPQSLQKAYEEIKQNHTRIHGVIHSAVGIFDQSLAKMEEKQFRDILSVKIDVSVRMAQVFQSEPLDFVLFFSSIAAWEKAGGMSGYSAGSTFKDAFALQLSRDWNCKVKVMNWGNWSIGTGDTISKASKIRLQQAGIRTIDVKEGLEALEVLLTGSRDQLVFMKTQNPQGLEIMDSNEWMTGYPETIPSCVNNIQKIAKPEVQQQNLQSASIFQNEAIEEPLLKLYGGILQSLRLIGTDKTATDPIAFYHRWLAESRKILTKRNALPNNPSLALEAIWKEWEQTTSHWKQDPDKKAAVILVEACLRALPDILTGKQRATDVIFPQASMELVEGLFRGNLVADYFNEFLGNALVAIIQQRSVLEQSKHSDPTAIRILEIGAGTGGTTANILPKLKPFRQQIEEYCYTDISKAFLFHAEEHFASQYPYIRTQLFDVEKPLAQQNIQAGQYDLVIATNVLHATKNIRQTLRNAKALLRKRGIILLNEISDKSLYAHLTFGLLEGWWLNEDDALRIPGSPALYPEVWQRVLQEEGFYSVLFPAQSEHRLGQQIVIAESDGIIRQKQEHTVKTGELPEQPLRRVPVKSPQKEITQDLIKEKTTEYFKTLVGKTLKIEASQIDSSEPLESYGIDSILIGQITSVLREEFDEVKGTLFFEVQTIDALVEYFINNHKERLSEIFGPNHPGAEEEIVDEETSQPTELGLEMPEHLQTSAGTEQPVKIHQGKGDQEKIQSASDAIAVIGMSGRYPKAETLENYWENLQTGRSCITEVPMDRWSLTGFFEPDPDKAVAEGKSYNKWGGFLDGFADFDPLFFNISAQDANDMDPQGRLLLQECWRAFEEAGYVPSQLDLELRDHIGVYCAMTKVGYNTSFAAMVNRVSYAMDLQGPSIPVDAMCASGLVALHQACESLRRRDIHMALVGAVNLYVEPNAYIKLCRLQMLADSAVPKVFGEGGKGFVPSEGVGAVVLKRLADAERDNDTVLAVIRGSAVNHNGKVNGYGVPNPLKQEAVIRHALENARVSPESIAYVESAANGSEMGDAIEMEALTRIFQHNRNGNPSAYRIGSLKSTLGHGESVSAMAQFMKVVLQLNHKKLCPTRVSEQRNPEIHFDTLPFTIQSELEDWPQLSLKGKKIPRRAGINSMGAGGVNAHMIVEEYLPPIVKEPNLAPASAPVVFVLSAKTEQVFTHYLTLWKDYLGKHPGSDLTRLAFSLQMGREMMKYRFACVVTSSKELILCLESAAKKESQPHCYKGVIDHTENIGALIEDHQIESLLVKKDLNKLARLWVNGATISWEKLYLEEMPKHLPLLPTYPFVRKTYWHGAMPTPELPEKIAQCTADNNGANFPVEKLLPSVGGDNDPCSVDLKPTRKIIRAVINNMLNFDTEDEIDQGMSFSEMGFSSITIVLFIEKLNQEFDLTLRETTAFDYPNIQELTLYISTQLLEREEKQVSIETEIKKSDGEEGPINKNEYESILLDFVQNKINEQDALDQIGL
jgi:acyl transferase domain-containing protein/acyl carrier protein/ubiquinone/menaquinone biosynthesis C-methylase UbiE